MTPRVFFALGILCISGCTVGVSDESRSNAGGIPCSGNSDCGTEMTCQDGLCRGNAAIPKVLMDITFPASENLAGYSASSFALMLDVPANGHGDIVLPSLESLSVDANFDQLNGRNFDCNYERAGGTARTVQAVLSHQWPLDGLVQNPPRIANDIPAKFNALPVESDYEVYLSLSDSFQSSLMAQNLGCGLPPVLFRDVAVGPVSSITLNWPIPKTIAVDIQVTPVTTDSVADIEGWQLDVVDSVEGRELAIPVTLGPPVVDGSDPKKTHHRVVLAYNPIASALLSPPVGTEILRLQPASARIAPTYYAAISSLSLFGSAGEFVLPLNGVPPSVVLTGLVETADSREPVKYAELTFTNLEFSVPNSGLGARFWGSVTSDNSGQFEIALPSGNYQVVAIPPNDQAHASLETNWTIQSQPSTQGGRLISLPLLSHLTGSVDGSVHWGSSASATVQATPCRSVLVDGLAKVATIRQSSSSARISWVPVAAGQTNSFDLPTDLGDFDLSMRTPEGMPWIVTAGIAMSSTSEMMRPWSMPLPVSWSGRLRVPKVSESTSSNLDDLPRAVLRVFVLLNSDRKQVLREVEDGAWVSQIAETRAEADGTFSLVLPDQLQPQ
jgi:hypothetical protein